MAIPAFNYAALTPQGDPAAARLIQSLQEGMATAFMPSQMKQNLKQQELANALAQIKLGYAPQMSEADLASQLAKNELLQQQSKYYGPITESDIALKQAQLPIMQAQAQREQFLAKNPLLAQAGPAGLAGAIMYLKAHPELNQGGNPGQEQLSNLPTVPGLSDVLTDYLTADIRRKSAVADLTGQRAEAYPFQQLPVDKKNQLLAQAAGLGIGAKEAISRFSRGEGIEDMAVSLGFDSNNMPSPIYPTTKEALTQIQRRQQSLEEINTLQPILTEAMAPYSRRIYGFSPKQIAEGLKGTNPDAQAKYLAAQALQPELSALRVKAMGGQVGIEAIREITHASMGNIKSLQPLVSANVYTKANEYVDQWINQAVSSANKVGLSPTNPELNGKNLPNPPQVPGLTISPEQAKTLASAGIGTHAETQPNNNQSVRTKMINGKTYTQINGKWYLQ